MQSPHPTSPAATHGPNPVGGRDFVIGDLHGEFDTLEHALEALAFEPARDRLFTLGDLIDRGPRSADALEWLEAGKFAGTVRGNHEQMMVHTLLLPRPFTPWRSGPAALWQMNGAEWWLESDEAERERARRDDDPPPPIVGRWLDALAGMPYVTTIEYAERRVGLVHSPGATDTWIHWSRLCEWTENVCADSDARDAVMDNPAAYRLLWREPLRLSESRDDPKLREPLPDVDLVLSGHTPGLHPRWARRNVLCIDTGVHYEELGHLTVAEVHDGLVLHRFARTERFE